MSKTKLNIKKHKKLRRKVLRKDKGWEEILVNLTIKDINKYKGELK
jgi:hypothetical protein